MDDLISRQMAIDALEREKTYCTAFRDGYTPINVFEKYNAGLTDGIKALKNLPSAQPEQKCGKWIWMGDKGDSRFMCSVCKWKENVPTIMGKPSVWDYCPSCGAYMREEENG